MATNKAAVVSLLLLFLVTWTSAQFCGRGAQANIARGRPAFQSSSYNSKSVASKAVDGNTATKFNSNSCTHTKGENFPWWYVDLGSTKQIGTIVLTNRGDCCGSRLNNIEIRIGDIKSTKGGTENPALVGSPFKGAITQGGNRAYFANGMAGRYVYIRLAYGNAILTLCEVQISEFCPNGCFNLAMNQPATQSSYGWGGLPGHGNDGNAEPIYNARSCTHTQSTTNPWWRVDLGMLRKVSLVRITNRGDCCSSRLNGFEIRLGGASGPTSSYYTCNTGDNQKTIFAGQTNDFSCTGLGDRAVSQYVYIYLPGGGKILTLCEVEVYENCTTSCNNVALKQPTKQKDSGWGGVSSRAVDGNTNGNFGGKSCSHTLNKNGNANNWWYVDLGREYQISSISVANRKDCCYTTYTNLQLTVGNKISDYGKSNPTCRWPKNVRSSGITKYPCSNLRGRYVSAQMWSYNTPLVLCEVMACGFPLPNSASGKPVWMSSKASGTSEYFAIDGSTSTVTSRCAMTAVSDQPWLTVDLGEYVVITSLFFTFPTSTTIKANIKKMGLVYTSSDLGFGSHITCANFSTYDGKASTFSMICNGGTGTEGRYIRIQLAAASKVQLGICEVEINTAKRIQCKNSGFQGRRCTNPCPQGTGGVGCTRCPSAVFGPVMLAGTSTCIRPKGGEQFPVADTTLEYSKNCSDIASQFAFGGNGALQHLASGLCVVPININRAAPIPGSLVKLSAQCTSSYSTFNYEAINNRLIHDQYYTFCMQPFQTGVPKEGTDVTMNMCTPVKGVFQSWQLGGPNVNQWMPAINIAQDDARFYYNSKMWTDNAVTYFGNAADLSKNAFLSTYDTVQVVAFSVTMGTRSYNFTLPADQAGRYSLKELVTQGKLSFDSPEFQGRSNLYSLSFSGTARSTYYCNNWGFSQKLFTGVGKTTLCQGLARIGVTTSFKTQYGPVQTWNLKCMSVAGKTPKDNTRVLTTGSCFASSPATYFYMTTDSLFVHSSGACIRAFPSVTANAKLQTIKDCTKGTRFEYRAGSRQLFVKGTKYCIRPLSKLPGDNVEFRLSTSCTDRQWNYLTWLAPSDSANTPCQRNKPLSAEGIGLTSGCWPAKQMSAGNLQGESTQATTKFFTKATVRVLGVPRCLGAASCNRVLGTCDCPAGTYGTSCELPCPTGLFGVGCRQTCNCQNGAACNATTGVCVCKPGFKGADCSVPCPGKTYGFGCMPCKNCTDSTSAGCNPVSGMCQCNAGYGGATCTSMCNAPTSPTSLQKKWGPNCINKCTCSANAVCNGVDGSCTCLAGWTGARCSRTCPTGTFGLACAFTCSCKNGGNCDSATGACTCLSGYKGSDCASSCVSASPSFQCGLSCAQKCNCDPTNGICSASTCGCSSCSPGYAGVFCNQTCPVGRYGQGCAMTCNCANGGSCRPTDGMCTCSAGWSGTTCTAKCQPNRWGPNCLQPCSCGHGTCNPVNGKCDCDAGYAGTGCNVLCKSGFWGLNCAAPCKCNLNYVDKTASSICDAITGICNCLSPRIGTCDTICPKFQWGQPCGSKGTCTCIQANSVDCDQQTGKCACKAGWMGTNCQTACGTGRWGQDCSQTCSCHSRGSTCDPVTGNCNCLAGYFGHTCAGTCASGSYGVNCAKSCNCIQGTCSPTTGACTCLPGYQGTGCNQACPSNTFGLGCAATCSCINGTCDTITGSCSCKAGFAGSSCDQVCAPGKYGAGCALNCPNCKNSAHATGSCNPADGSCICLPGYRGSLCHDTCPAGWYGLNCAMKCSCSGSPCNETSGVCLCNPGAMGTNCSQSCPANRYGPGCTGICACFNGATCSNKTGMCACAPGYYGSSCVDACPAGHYGANCHGVCNCALTGTCNTATGACVCDVGYTGSTCASVLRCPLGLYGAKCNVPCRCQNNATCAAANGMCTCARGFTGIFCEQGCPAGRFGVACTGTCQCTNGVCRPADGSCDCYAGYTGATCLTVCPDNWWGANCVNKCNCTNADIVCNKQSGTCVDPTTGAVKSGDDSSSSSSTVAIVVPIIVVLVVIGVIVVVVVVRSVRKVEKKLPAGMYTADDSDITFSSGPSAAAAVGEHGITNPTYADPGQIQTSPEYK